MIVSTPNQPKPVLHSSQHNRVILAHGGGGQLTDELIANVVLSRLGNPSLDDLLDCGVVPTKLGNLALTTDSYVVQPLFFPGADIGRLAVSGTVNDLAVCGAQPLALSLGLIIEEGLERAVLERVLESIAATTKEAGVRIITGDTKVVGRGQADGLYITTAGIGLLPEGRRVHPDRLRAGDVLLINGFIADHGLAVMIEREMPDMKMALQSDAAPLNGLIRTLLDELGDSVAFMRDPTRGGLSGVVADLAARTGLRVVLEENHIPIRPTTRHAAELLGIDPLEVANEGKVLIAVRPDVAERALIELKNHPLGRDAAVIGRVEEATDGLAELHTALGGRRIIQKPYGEQLPRIC